MKRTIQSILTVGLVLLTALTLSAQKKEMKVSSFDKVIISPHIEVTFIKGDEEMVIVEDVDVPLEKLNIDVDGRTLKIYLDGAKTYTKSKKVKNNGQKARMELYQGTQAEVTVIYRNLKDLEVRGEELVELESPLVQDQFDLALYGETDVLIKSAELDNLMVALYGESTLKIEDGEIRFQKYKAYGESEVDALGITNSSAKITAFGESEFRISVSDRLKVTSYGEADVQYRGNPSIDKGVVLGENSITKI